ncbi:adenylyl-sulfate reductase subunit alpha [Desulfuribacillus alkaliarsenatis]|uniref:Adenylylsulfate reductase n=1 Tax=Desulfuribacillus alkaliarsenatis TaxID=766136 RepID=A0A1E5G3M8_9FIRM|nr:adenylyl-sulfate reductase subunit alpha [Desulfuribacillus alkaliarsenatis]OEF97663.1 adenylylsulfate reductase [Desulfuribacillus alkaliarsenatis]
MSHNYKHINTDILIIGGGTAGCLAAVEAKELNPELQVTILEKANIERSGCLAAGMNAINAYLNPGETPESFTKYVRYDACGLLREDLVLSQSKEFEYVVKKVESWGLPILKDEQGNYQPRGRWNIKINGEKLKPIIAKKAIESGVEVINRAYATNYIVDGGAVKGVYAASTKDDTFYVIRAKKTIVATGGAAGIYKPNNTGDARHKIWYSPFNAGAGYAMGIRAGAEMTSFEHRFIALRTKDIISPTGTLALGFGAPQVNANKEKFMQTKLAHVGGEGAPTPYRVFGPTREMKEGRGPCYMDTTHLTKEQAYELKKSFLDMYPDIVLYWAANGIEPDQEPIEIQGTEPYIMGGHNQAGYWVTEDRKTTLEGLFAAGDVAGGAPFKFVSGCFAEGVIAARKAVKELSTADQAANTNNENTEHITNSNEADAEYRRVYQPLARNQAHNEGITYEEMEDRLQKIMDEYAGGVSSYYEMSEPRLKIAEKRLKQLREQIPYLIAEDHFQLMNVHEIIDRIDVAEVLVQHLLYRKETRWPAYQSRTDFPERNDIAWLKFVNSYKDKSGNINMVERPYEQIVPGDRYLPR